VPLDTARRQSPSHHRVGDFTLGVKVFARDGLPAAMKWRARLRQERTTGSSGWS